MTRSRRNASALVSTLAALGLFACGGEKRSDQGGTPQDGGGVPSADDDDDDDDDDDGDADEGDGSRLDIGDVSDGGDDENPDGTPSEDCDIPEHEPCDDDTNDPFEAMGLNCPGEPEVDGEANGSTEAIAVISSVGDTDTWAPTEGVKYAVIGSGPSAHLNQTSATDLEFCSLDLGAEWDLPGDLPDPIKVNQVGNEDCTENPSLVGTGDCSNTLQEQWDAAATLGGPTAFDYTELRFTATVPSTVTSVSYDFAFFSTEYPYYFGSPYNDMYVGWLESRNWTGNISFDKEGNPISVNAGFLDYRDVPNPGPDTWGYEVDQECNTPGACVAEELHQTCMKSHAGTAWLTSTVGVEEHEDITMVFAVFDLSDPILDSYVLLDNFTWGCEPGDGPETEPIE